MAVIERQFMITINDINPNFVCTNKAFLRIFETVACIHSDLAGFGAGDIERTRLSWILLGWKLQVIKRPKYGETVTVSTWARDTARVSTHRDFELRSASGELYAIATSKWALVHIENGLQKINDIIKDNYQPSERCVFEQTELKRLKEPTDFLTEFQFTVTRRDIDLNKHVHNLNYLDYAYEIIPEDLFLQEGNNLEISYKTEAKLGDTLVVKYAKQGDIHTATIHKDDGKLCAIVNISK